MMSLRLFTGRFGGSCGPRFEIRAFGPSCTPQQRFVFRLVELGVGGNIGGIDHLGSSFQHGDGFVDEAIDMIVESENLANNADARALIWSGRGLAAVGAAGECAQQNRGIAPCAPWDRVAQHWKSA